MDDLTQRVAKAVRGSGTDDDDRRAADGIDSAVELMAAGRVMLLSGAGLSTESGIPDYRGSTSSARRGTPMTYAEFVATDDARRRYWARSHLGWRVIAGSRPNAGHYAVAALERACVLSGVVTQNVDGLHQVAGAVAVTELHGNLSAVVCLGCGRRTTRRELDERLRLANPYWEGLLGGVRPDGDAVVADEMVAEFTMVACRVCGGVLKPDVVFFGESVPKQRVQRCFELLEASNALLVAGSSLTVMSGYRFVLRAGKLGIPVAIVNQGATRGDDLAAVRIDAPLGSALSSLAQRLVAR